MSWGAQNRSKDAKTPSGSRGRSDKPELDRCPVQPYTPCVHLRTSVKVLLLLLMQLLLAPDHRVSSPLALLQCTASLLLPCTVAGRRGPPPQNTERGGWGGGGGKGLEEPLRFGSQWACLLSRDFKVKRACPPRRVQCSSAQGELALKGGASDVVALRTTSPFV
jgi:hypothetical protein